MKTPTDNILKKYLTNECSKEELFEIASWISDSDDNARQLFRMEQVYHLGKFDQYEDPQRVALAEKRLFKKLEAEKRKENKPPFFKKFIKYAAVVAIILLGSGISYWYLQGNKQKEILVSVANNGNIKEITLPDGSKVWLNNSATLRYPQQFTEKQRNVYLDGEAYFEVTKDQLKPFIVESSAMQVRVLGTKFNFKCDKSCAIAEASLIEGEIEVKGNRDEGMIILAPGQRAELNTINKRLTVKQVNTKMDAVWHDDFIPFEKADIFMIAKTLERFYHARIILSPDIQSDKTYSGVLKRKATIESVLRSLQNSIPISYKVVGNNIFISPECKNKIN